MPFIGRGDNPPSSPVDVHVTAYLDRLLHVDDKEYAFSVSGRVANASPPFPPGWRRWWYVCV
jgi:hypothetical protein